MLNVVSWGILLPIGAITARYLKVFKSADPAWFYLHVFCQSSAYIVGVAGWGTGLKLGSESAGIQYNTHRTIGIVLFCIGTLQVIKNNSINVLVLKKVVSCCVYVLKASFSLSGVCFASKAKTRTQAENLLEHLPPPSWLQCHCPKCGQHFPRIRYPES